MLLASRSVIPFAVLFLLLLPRAGAASPTIASCIQSSELGQEQRDHGKLSEAQRSFQLCASTTCPDAIRTACNEWGAALVTRIPSIVVQARDAAGHDVRDGTVTLDGVPLQNALNGLAVAVDPGPHTLRLQTPDGSAVEQSLVVREGERGRGVALTLPVSVVLARDDAAQRPPPAAASKPRKGPPATSWVLAGVGVAAFGIATGFGASGMSARGDLGACRPSCSAADVSSVRTRFLIADIAIATGVVALAVASVVWLTSPKSAASRTASLLTSPLRGLRW